MSKQSFTLTKAYNATHFDGCFLYAITEFNSFLAARFFATKDEMRITPDANGISILLCKNETESYVRKFSF
jgi:hypothetical protein